MQQEHEVRLLSPQSADIVAFKSQNNSGTTPLMLLPLIFNKLNLVRFPSSGGKKPDSSLLSSLSISNPNMNTRVRSSMKSRRSVFDIYHQGS